jgi:hypothetical protein
LFLGQLLEYQPSFLGSNEESALSLDTSFQFSPHIAANVPLLKIVFAPVEIHIDQSVIEAFKSHIFEIQALVPILSTELVSSTNSSPIMKVPFNFLPFEILSLIEAPRLIVGEFQLSKVRIIATVHAGTIPYRSLAGALSDFMR